MLLNGLPADSRYHTELRNRLSKDDLKSLTADHDPEQERWSRLESLMAGADERLQLLLIALVSAIGGDPPEFQPIYRPGVPKPEGPRELTAEERAAQRAELLARWDGTRKHPTPGA